MEAVMSFRLSYIRQKMWLWATLIAMMCIGGVASAATPPAGYIIGNQAAAQYVVDGQTFTVTSNLVETVIAQKAAAILTQNQTLNGTPGSTVEFPHQITNTGNAADTFNLTAVVASGTLSNVAIYADANGDGIPDSTTPLTVTPTLALGGTFNFVVSGTIPSTATVPSVASLTITAASVFDNTQTAINTDTVNVVNSAVLDVTKAFSVGSAAPGSTVAVTLTYTNTGNQTSGNVKLTDVLPAGLTYVASSAKWNGTVLNDNGTGNPAGITYSVTGSQSVTATLASVAPGQSGTITFNVKVVVGTAPGIINNIASIYADLSNTGQLPTTPTFTNSAPLTILNVSSVTVTDLGSTTDFDGVVDGIVTQGTVTHPVFVGSAVLFDAVIINNSNGSEVFNIYLPTHGYPLGTTFTLLRADGVTPLTDTNSDGIVDTGPIAPGTTIHVFVRAQLPTIVTGTGPFDATIQATSATTPAVTGSVIGRIQSVSAAVVDLTNDAAGTLGQGQGPEITAVTTLNANPNSTVTFDLYINHTASILASYLLQYSSTATFVPGTVNVMPAGWSVKFVDGVTGATVTSATLAAPISPVTSTQYHYKAIVTIPESALSGNQAVYFRAISSALGISDTIYDQISINSVHDIALQPNHVGQIYPGSSYVYHHVLQNQGSIIETSGAVSVNNTGSASGWSATVYLDSNNNGSYEPGVDPVFTDISQIAGGLAPNASVNVFVKVQAPAGALPGDNSVTTLTVTVTGDVNVSDNSVTDQTTVISGIVTLLKEQAADAACTTSPTAATYQTSPITSIKPGQCVIYRITGKNTGLIAVTNLVISDPSPVFTTLHAAATTGGTAAATPALTQPGVGTVGLIQATWSALQPSETAILYYKVQLNP